IIEPLRLLHRGKLPLAVGSEEVDKPEMTADDRANVVSMLSDPDHIFITHTRAFLNFPKATERLRQFAAERGFRQEMLAVISDTHDRPAFEVFRFTRPSARHAQSGTAQPH